MPGPGEYHNPHEDFGKNGKKITLKGKATDKLRDDSPGPGAYEPSLKAVRDQSPCMKWNKPENKNSRNEAVSYS